MTLFQVIRAFTVMCNGTRAQFMVLGLSLPFFMNIHIYPFEKQYSMPNLPKTPNLYSKAIVNHFSLKLSQIRSPASLLLLNTLFFMYLQYHLDSFLIIIKMQNRHNRKSPSSIFKQHEENSSNFNPGSCSCEQYVAEEYCINREEVNIKVEGQWSAEECIKYIVFMHFHNQIFLSKTKRKYEKIFKKLSDYLGTRTPRQCRSHFQKLKNRFGTLTKMRANCKKEVGQSTYDKYYQQMAKQLNVSPASETEETKRPQKISVDFGTQTDQLPPYAMKTDDMLGSPFNLIPTAYDHAMWQQWFFWAHRSAGLNTINIPDKNQTKHCY